MAGPFFTSVGLPHVHGVYTHTVTVPPGWGVTREATILASATEIGGGTPGHPFIGSASIQVLNIAPGNNEFGFRINVEWPLPLAVWVKFVIWPGEKG
jgi:hypothetical protein